MNELSQSAQSILSVAQCSLRLAPFIQGSRLQYTVYLLLLSRSPACVAERKRSTASKIPQYRSSSTRSDCKQRILRYIVRHLHQLRHDLCHNTCHTRLTIQPKSTCLPVATMKLLFFFVCPGDLDSRQGMLGRVDPLSLSLWAIKFLAPSLYLGPA